MIILMITPLQLASQSSAENIRSILDSIYNQNFTEASKAVEALGTENPLEKLLQCQIMRWQHVPIALSSIDDKYLQTLEQSEQILNKQANDAKLSLYYKAANYLLLAEHHFLKGNELRAVGPLRKAYQIVEVCLKDTAPIPEINFIKGLYLTYADIYHYKNFAGKLLTFPLEQGDKRTGLKLLNEVAFSNSLAGTEAAIYYGHILLHFDKDYRNASKVYERLSKLYPENNKFREYYVESLLSLKEYLKAEKLIPRLHASRNTFYHSAADLFSGIIAEELYLDPALADKHYRRCIKNGEAYAPLLDNYVKEAHTRLTK